MKDYCPQCNMVVAPQDPQREKWGTLIFHGGCRNKLRERARLRNEEMTLLWQGTESKLIFVPEPR